jgi:hypothetical protein
VPVALPPGKVTVLELVREKPLEDIRLRADLALSPLELKVDGGAVTAVAHNIGSAAADEVEVALVDPAGKVRDRKKLGPLAAPTDLAPKRVEFRLQGVPRDPAGWAVVIDPDGRVSEIFEGNNRVELAPARR